MRRKNVMAVVGLATAVLGSSCGSGTEGTEAVGGGEVREVLVDFKHDEFASTFNGYFPRTVSVRPGDTVRFEQAWTGEAHSVTMGKVVDDMFEVAPKVEKYDSPEEAAAAGESPDFIKSVDEIFGRVPGMMDFDAMEPYQPGARPCFIADMDDVPAFNAGEKPNPDAKCPTEGEEQPAFAGTNALYNSGFIPFEGHKGNTFEVPIAKDAKPGTYNYFCNFHWTSMAGKIEIVGDDADIPSQAEVSKQARKEIAEQAEQPLERFREVKKGLFGDSNPPLSGVAFGSGGPHEKGSEEERAPNVFIDEFVPATIKAKVGEPVTWTFEGSAHTVSFNVPKYFPVFTIDKKGDVQWDPKSHEVVGWDPPKPPDGPPPEGAEESHGPPPQKLDVGKWDGKGFHSSGALFPGSTFTVTFTKPGKHTYACVLHPQMTGQIEIK